MGEGKFEQSNLCEHGNVKEACEICIANTDKDAETEIHPKPDQGPIETLNSRDEARTDEDMLKADRESEVEYAPEGWMTKTALADAIDSTGSTVARMADQYRKTNPEWFVTFKDKGGHKKEHLSPELLSKITSEIQGRESAPEGWMTNSALSEVLSRAFNVIKNIAEQYRATNSEWFKYYADRSNKNSEHYSPDLVAKISEEIKSREPAPEGWVTKKFLTNVLGKSYTLLTEIIEKYRESNPEWFGLYETPRGYLTEHYAPDLVSSIMKEMEVRQSAPAGWLPSSTAGSQMGIGHSAPKTFAERYRQEHPEWFHQFTTPKGVLTEHFAPELIEMIREDFNNRKFPPENWRSGHSVAALMHVSEDTIHTLVVGYRAIHPDWFREYDNKRGGISEYFAPELITKLQEDLLLVPPPPEGYMTNSALASELGKSFDTVERAVEKYRGNHADWFPTHRSAQGKVLEYYSPELIAKIKEEFSQQERAPEGWMTNFTLSKKLSVAQKTPEPIAVRFRDSNPQWFKIFYDDRGRAWEYYSPELVRIISDELRSREVAPQGWYTNTEAARILGTHPATLSSIANRYRETNPDWFRSLFHRRAGTMFEHYSPDLITRLKAELENRGRYAEREAEDYLIKLSTEGTTDAKQFRDLINIFGGSNAVDILYRLHPSFRGVPVDRIHGLIAQYLGDFLLLQPGLNLDDIGGLDDLKNYLSEDQLRQGLLEVVKDSCLSYVQKQRKENRSIDEMDIIHQYFAGLRERVSHLHNVNILDIVEEVEGYYSSLHVEIGNPANMVDQLREGRAFPDLNQRINIKEIEQKKKVLIADEMGLGKSASAILSKEHLGVRCALIVAPSNVISTWQRYLSDAVGEDGKQMGYFKPGKAPNVLTIEDPEDLAKISSHSYNYVLVSQERLNKRHMDTLKELDYDMLIVDEVHKLKNVVEGVRSENIVELAKKMNKDEQYVVMLSGTPVPNKVVDVAILLKTLYPDRFAAIQNKDLVRSIIKGDIVDLRSLLVPRMQLKRLQESIDMPPLTESVVEIELSKAEEEIYNILLEDDELTAAEKITVLRQFLLNPELLKVTPPLGGTKIQVLHQEVHDAFMKHERVIVFVNGYIENVIRGDHTIFKNMSLPEDCSVCIIDGTTPQEERQSIQQRLQRGDKKMLVFVSGQTADVGVDFSGADHIIDYNEPWTEGDKRQQIGRVYREGHTKPLEVRTLIVKKTIEDGIHKYIAIKQHAIEKLLRGIPRTEMETKLLEQDEKQIATNREVNPQLAEYYFSSWERMMKIFAYVREMGEASFIRFLDQHGEEYANCYTELGSTTYQANNSRVVASLVQKMLQEKGMRPEDARILDIASGPEMLKRHTQETFQKSVVSMDINPHHFDARNGMTVIGSFSRLPFESGSMDYCNLALALHYTRFVPSRGDYERLRVMTEMNRVLKVGGRGIISLITNIDLKNSEAFHALAPKIGFKVVDAMSGVASNSNNYNARIITLEKTEDIPKNRDTEAQIHGALTERLGRKALEGLKLQRNGPSKLKNTRRIITDFTLTGNQGSKDVHLELNERDTEIHEEEQATLHEAHALKSKYKTLENIPEQELVARGFSRLVPGKRPILFKKLHKGGGGVIVK